MRQTGGTATTAPGAATWNEEAAVLQEIEAGILLRFRSFHSSRGLLRDRKAFKILKKQQMQTIGMRLTFDSDNRHQNTRLRQFSEKDCRFSEANAARKAQHFTIAGACATAPIKCGYANWMPVLSIARVGAAHTNSKDVNCALGSSLVNLSRYLACTQQQHQQVAEASPRVWE